MGGQTPPTVETEPPETPGDGRWRSGWASLLTRAGQAAADSVAVGLADARADLSGAFGHLLQSHHIGKTLLAIVAALYFLSGVYVVQTGEEAVVRRFGGVVAPRVAPGLNYRLPWPFERADVVDVGEVRREGIGVTIPGHSAELHPPEEFQVLTGDENLINLRAIAQYRVQDPPDYLLAVDYNEAPLVRNAIKAAFSRLLGRLPVDEVLTSGRAELQQAVQREAQQTLDRYRSGLQIATINLQEIAPPREVADAFRDVASAREDRERAVNDATGYKNSLIPQARGEAERLRHEAEGYRTEVVNRARGDAERFNGVLAEYVRSREAGGADVTRQRLYLEAMEKVLARVKKYVVQPGDAKVNVRILDSLASPSGARSAANAP